MKRRTAFAILVAVVARPAFALYDPKPDASLSAVQGEWKGTLTYRDYSQPDRLVSLPTRLFVALSAPSELVFHWVFDDGPAKAVYSYERLAVDAGTGQITWSSGIAEKSVGVHRIVADAVDGDTRRLVFEKKDGDETERHTLVLSPAALRLSKEEVNASGEDTFRNKYEFARP